MTLRAARLRVESSAEGAAEVGCENDAEEGISGFAEVDAAWLEPAINSVRMLTWPILVVSGRR